MCEINTVPATLFLFPSTGMAMYTISALSLTNSSPKAQSGISKKLIQQPPIGEAVFVVFYWPERYNIFILDFSRGI